MGWTLPDGIRCAKVKSLNNTRRRASVGQVTMIGLDIAKHAFQAHGADPAGKVVFRKKLSRAKMLAFFASLEPCVVALEAAGARITGDGRSLSSGMRSG